MPLSEHEQKLLEQMERALYAEDPSFATQMKGGGRPTSKRRIALGAVVAVLGLVIVLLGVNNASIPLGIVGFLVMVAGIVWAATPRPEAEGVVQGARPVHSTRPGHQGGRKGGSTGSFMQRLDERWDRRRERGY